MRIAHNFNEEIKFMKPMSEKDENLKSNLKSLVIWLNKTHGILSRGSEYVGLLGEYEQQHIGRLKTKTIEKKDCFRLAVSPSP